MDISNDEIAYFGGLTRDKIISLKKNQKQKYFFSLQVRHKKLEYVFKDLRSLLSPYNETNILSIIGATGVGKTNLSRR